MEDEDFLDLSIEDRENKLTIFKEEMGSLGNLDYRPAGGVQNLAGILGKGVTSDIFQEASIWANTSKTNRYESGDELNSKFPNLFPELEGKQFPTYEVKNGAVNVLDQQVNPENAEGKWGKIQSAIDKGTSMYANQEIDGVISDPGLMPEGSDEDVKKNLIQYGQVMALTDPKYKQRYAGQDSPFEDPKSAFQFTKQARNFQGIKFKVNALRYVAANCPAEPGELVERDRAGAGAIGRVHQDHVQRLGRRTEREDRGGADVRADAELLRIGAQRVERRAILLDEQARGGAARQCLEPQRAGTGEEIGDGQIFEAPDAAGEHREQRFARAIGGGAGGVALGRGERTAAPLASNDPHLRGPRLPGPGLAEGRGRRSFDR